MSFNTDCRGWKTVGFYRLTKLASFKPTILSSYSPSFNVLIKSIIVALGTQVDCRILPRRVLYYGFMGLLLRFFSDGGVRAIQSVLNGVPNSSISFSSGAHF